MSNEGNSSGGGLDSLMDTAKSFLGGSGDDNNNKDNQNKQEQAGNEAAKQQGQEQESAERQSSDKEEENGGFADKIKDAALDYKVNSGE